MSGSLVLSEVQGQFAGRDADLQEQNPVVVFAVGDQRAQTKALRAPGSRPVWHETYKISSVALDQPLVLSATVYDVRASRNEPLGTGALRVYNAGGGGEQQAVQLSDPQGRHVGELAFHLDIRRDNGGAALQQRAGAATKTPVLASDTAYIHKTATRATAQPVAAEGPSTPPAAAALRAPGVVEREYRRVGEGEEGPVREEKRYTVVEDRPVEKERRMLLREVHRWEKDFVIETRFLGERELADRTTVEVLSSSERIISARESRPCDNAPELVLQQQAP